jgi:hypothetical protein
MRWVSSLLSIALCCIVSAQGQKAESPALGFNGCYEVVSLSWNPPDETIRLVPPRFELTANKRVLPLPSKTGEIPWGSWTADSDKLKITFGHLGGFRGTLKRSASAEFEGKLKEYCDSRCEWKKRVGKIRIRKITCLN